MTISNTEVDIKCPKCKRTLKVMLKDLAPGKSKRCACGSNIVFSGDDVKKTSADLDAMLKGLSKKFSIKL